MAYDLKYDKLLRAIESGRQSEAISFFERRVFDVNESIRYLFEDGKRFVVTPLYWSVRHNCPKLCRYLLRNGARPYGTVVYEYYPLHEACNRGYDLVVQEFVSARGVEMDKVNSDADTPLHVACMRGHIQCVHILLGAGSDCSLRNKLGHTPLQSAVYHDRTDLVELFRAHNKGIETTPPGVSSAHQRHGVGGGGVSALTALPSSTGVKVQRSHSFNTAASLAGMAERRVMGQTRIRAASHERSQSYYENGAASSLVIGQAPLSSFSSQSMLSLSSTSSGPSSYTTIPSHIPSTTYSSLSPDSPVELDAPKRLTKNTDQSCHTTSLQTHKGMPSFPPPPPPPPPPAAAPATQTLISTATAKSPSQWRYPKPDDDFGTCFESSSGLILTDSGRDQVSNLKTFCPFPSPGGPKKDPLERNISPPKQVHPLSTTKRSDHHRIHGEKVFQERFSHPEFSIPKRDIHITDRAKSSNDVFLGNCSRREDSENLPLPSQTREHIHSLTQSLCSAIDTTNSTVTHRHLNPSSSSSSSSSSPPLHPLLLGLRDSLASRAHHYGLSPDHHRSLSQLAAVPKPPFPSLESLSSAPSSSSSSSSSSASLSSNHLPSFQEVDFEVIEGPLERRIWSDEEEEGGGGGGGGGEGLGYSKRDKFATLSMKVQVCDPLVQLRTPMNQGDIVLLKVKVKVQSMEAAQPLKSSTSLGTSCHGDQLPEVAILNELPPHPNIASILYHCRGRTDKLTNLLSNIPRSDHHRSSHYRRPDSTLLESQPHSMPEEQIKDHTLSTVTYSPLSTGTFLYQSAPGVPLDRYFTDVIQKDSIVEEKFLLILTQLLLAVAHLEKNCVSHCAISSRSIYVSEQGGRVVLGDFGQAVNLRPKNLDVYRKTIRQLKGSKTRKLSPEAEEGLRVSDAESATTTSSCAVRNLEEAFGLSDSYAVGALCYELFKCSKDPLAGDEASVAPATPFINTLSFRSNHLLQKLVARNPVERYSALQGAVSCFVLLFGPRTSDVTTTTDCLHWLVTESLELYLNPVLRDSSSAAAAAAAAACFHGSNVCKRKLHYSYLSVASPEMVYDSCKFFSTINS